MANVLFWTILSGVFEQEGYGPWLLGLLLACAASLAWGLWRRQFAFVAYAAVYGYIGVGSMVVRDTRDATFVLMCFVTTAIAMVVLLAGIARHFGKGRPA